MTATVSAAPRTTTADRVEDSAVDVAVELRGLSKVYRSGRNQIQALDRIDLVFTRHSFTCVVGASGCGKSTMLSIIAGLDQPTTGELAVNGNVGLMFQESALFPWLTAEQNIELPMKLRRVLKAERTVRVQQLLQLVRLEGFGSKRPHELSGGMRQRVALARALAQDADVLLMDEPFGALDAMTRDVLHHELERIWQQTGATIIFVTHNVREAVRLGDRIVLLSSRPGRVVDSFDVHFARPRRIESPEVGSLSIAVTSRLRQEVARHGADVPT